jgi:hypothetical protein
MTPGGIGVVYQTGERWTSVDLVSQRALYVIRYPSEWCTPIERLEVTNE